MDVAFLVDPVRVRRPMPPELTAQLKPVAPVGVK